MVLRVVALECQNDSSAASRTRTHLMPEGFCIFAKAVAEMDGLCIPHSSRLHIYGVFIAFLEHSHRAGSFDVVYKINGVCVYLLNGSGNMAAK